MVLDFYAADFVFATLRAIDHKVIEDAEHDFRDRVDRVETWFGSACRAPFCVPFLESQSLVYTALAEDVFALELDRVDEDVVAYRTD